MRDRLTRQEGFAQGAFTVVGQKLEALQQSVPDANLTELKQVIKELQAENKEHKDREWQLLSNVQKTQLIKALQRTGEERPIDRIIKF